MLRKSRNYVAILLALLIGVSSVMPAFATEPEAGVHFTDDPDAPIEAVITKNLQMPAGTETPTATFNFEATPVSMDGKEDAVTKAAMPDLKHLLVRYNKDTLGVNTEGDVKSIKLQTGDILEDVNFNGLGAGIYIYEITESDSSMVEGVPSRDHQLILSKAVYTFTIYVENHPSVAGETYVQYVIVRVKAIDTEDGAKVNDKVDIRPGEGGMIFTNTYVKSANPENPDPAKDATLTVSNKVEGQMSYKDHPFEYTITMTSNKIHPEVQQPDYYRAYIVEDGKIIDPSDNAESDLIGRPGSDKMDYIKVAINGPTEFTLKDGQSLVFVDTPVGTKYDITQEGVNQHKPSYTITTNNEVGDKGEKLAGDSITTGTQLIGEPNNIAAFVNTRDFTAPAGLSLANVPFVAMIILGLSGLVAYIVVGVRKRKAY